MTTGAASIGGVLLLCSLSAPAVTSAQTVPPPLPAAVVVVIDVDAMSPGSLQKAKTAVAAFLDAGVPTGARVGVVASGRMLGEGLTTDGSRLRKVVGEVRPNSANVTRQGDVPLDRSDDKAAEIASDLYAGDRPGVDGETRARRALATLQAIESGVAAVEGSKTVVWVSDAFSAPNRDREKVAGHGDQVQAFLARAESGALTVVGVDVRSSKVALSKDDLWLAVTGGSGGSVLGSDKDLAKVVGRAAAVVRTVSSPLPATPAAAAAAAPAPTAALPPATPAAAPDPSSAAAAAEGATVAPPGPARGSAAVPSRLSPLAPDSGLRESLGGGAGVPDEQIAKVRMGWEAYQAGDTKGARAALSGAAANASVPLWARYVLGWAEFAEGNLAGARAQWSVVRREVPTFMRVYFDLADCSLQEQKPDDALAVLHDADKRWPANAEVMNAIGSVQVSLGRLDDALKSFEAAAARDANDSSAHFNLARTLELRYVRREQASHAAPRTVVTGELPRAGLRRMSALDDVRTSAGSGGGAGSDADLERSATEYRKAVNLKGAEHAEAAEGLRRTLAIDASTLSPTGPMLLGSFGDAALGGALPVRLAWSADGTYLCIGSLVVDRGRATGHAVRIITVWNMEMASAKELPDWAVTYWSWKSSARSPWLPSPLIRPERRRGEPIVSLSGRQTPVELLAFRLGAEVVGEAPSNTLGYGQGTTYGWSPYAMGALAFVDRRGVLVIVDRRGRKTEVKGASGNITLPAWSPDGVSVAYLEKSSRGYDLKIVDVYPK